MMVCGYIAAIKQSTFIHNQFLWRKNRQHNMAHKKSSRFDNLPVCAGSSVEANSKSDHVANQPPSGDSPRLHIDNRKINQLSRGKKRQRANTTKKSTYVGMREAVANKQSFLQAEIIVMILAFTFVFGCRWGVGVDYFHYLEAYQYKSFERFEIIFKFISEFLRNAGIHYSVFFSIWAFLQITLFYYAFRHQRFLFPLLAFFLIIGYGYMSWMNIIRQELAAGVFLVSLNYLDKRKPWQYLLCVAIAYGFHKSSLLLIIFYPLFLWKKDLFSRISVQLVIYVIAFIVSVFFSETIVANIEKPFALFTEFLGYDNYVYRFLEVESINSRTQFGTNTGYGIYITIFRTLPIILLSRQMKAYYNSSFFNIVYSLWFIRIITTFLIGDSIILNRPFAFLTNFLMIMGAYLVYYCFKSRKMYLQLFGVLYMIVVFLLFIYIVSNGVINTSKFLFFWQ